jgi:signal transduction histidine kinase
VGRRGDAVRFTEADQTTLELFAGQVSVALELASRRTDAERLSVYAERDRIGRDLHDLVIQRLFATGMALEAVASQAGDAVQAQRIHAAVDALDETVREIRSTIYGLSHDPFRPPPGLRQRVLEVVDAAEGVLGLAPTVRVAVPTDRSVPDEVAEHVVEALTNVARHARASRVWVEVEADEGVLVRVVDDGVGLPTDGRRSGLANLAERARLLGGSFSAGQGEGGGTELLWYAPLPG